jgi:hypothetical protein
MLRTLALATSLSLLAACAPRLQGDGVATVVDRSLDAFTALEVAGPIAVEVDVAPGATPGMHLQGDENLVALVGWSVVGDTLRIDARGLDPLVPLRLALHVGALDDVSSSDGARVTVNRLSGARLSLKASSSGRVHALAVDCDTLVLDARGNARVEAAGTARLVDAWASDESDVVALSVRARVARVLADHLSAIHVYASDAVSGRALRSSEVRVHGEPAASDVERDAART